MRRDRDLTIIQTIPKTLTIQLILPQQLFNHTHQISLVRQKHLLQSDMTVKGEICIMKIKEMPVALVVYLNSH
jgi:hypothetical protein